MDLAQLQRAMQRHVLGQDRTAEALVVDDPIVGADVRLGIYADSYVSRLLEALADTYPVLRAVLGEAAFDDLARSYVHAFPSTTPSIRWYGERLAAHAYGQAECTATAALLSDLARWEWALACAFDGPDSTPLDAATMAGIAPAEWAQLRFRFVPTLARIQLHTNAVAWWRARQHDEPWPERHVGAEASEWVIWRAGLKVQFRSLSAADAWLLGAAQVGASFGQLCEALARQMGDEAAPLRAATGLRQWVADGWLESVERHSPRTAE